ncbi:hypothetical protein MGSAQ_002783 [marine sediment metagenome]|uniref:Uncharacterized protein n=1 Tax=marine sediment metagenome TaxID=412755 RepID=A0A1B6NQK1_9ZZZZ
MSAAVFVLALTPGTFSGVNNRCKSMPDLSYTAEICGASSDTRSIFTCCCSASTLML